MKPDQPIPTTIDDYIALFPDEVRKILEKIRKTVGKAAPKAEEAIKYGMPTFVLKGNLVTFGAYKKHIGFYPAPLGVEEFKDGVAEYGSGKGTFQFPYDKPIPYDLIGRATEYWVEKNLEKAEAKGREK